MKKKIRKVGDSYGILLKKEWVDELRLTIGRELDVYYFDTAMVVVPDWLFVDAENLAQQIEHFQKAKQLEYEEKIMRDMRKELGNERLTRLQVAQRIVNEELEKDKAFKKFSADSKKTREAGVNLEDKEQELSGNVVHMDSPYWNKKPREPCDPETLKLWAKNHPDLAKKEDKTKDTKKAKGSPNPIKSE